MIIGLSNCMESVANPDGRFRTLAGIYPVAAAEGGAPAMRAGENGASFSVVFKNCNHTLSAFLGKDEKRALRLKEISTFVKLIDTRFLSDFIYLEDELLVFNNLDEPVYIDVALQKIPAGRRMDEYIAELAGSGGAIPSSRIICGLADMAKWMEGIEFRHGKISLNNIWISPDLQPVLFDYIGSSREVPAHDIAVVGAIAAAVYMIACEPGFYYYLAGVRSSAERRKRLPILLKTMGNIAEADGPKELKALISHLSGDNVPTSVICESIVSLAGCEPVPMETLSQTAGSYDRSKTSLRPLSMLKRLSRYTFIGEMNDMLMRACSGGGWRYLDKNGEVSIEGPFADARDFSEGRAVVETASGYGVIDRDGNFIIDPSYDDIEEDFPSGMFIVTHEGLSGLFSREGEAVTGLIYDQILDSGENLFPAKRYGRFGYIRRDGTMAIGHIYDDAFSFRDGVARVSLRGRDFLIDAENGEVDEVIGSRTVPGFTN